jgi:SAM-dependent methyltransferase
MSLWNDFYEDDEVLSQLNKDSGEEIIKLIEDKLLLEEISSVYDQCCGRGRLSILLENKGKKVFGCDISSKSIKFVKSVSKFPERFLLSDAIEYVTPEKVDLVINYYSSFGSVDNWGQNFVFIDRAIASLSEKGYFLLDIINKKFIFENFKENLDSKCFTRVSKLDDTCIYQEWINKETGKIFNTKMNLYDESDIIEYANSKNLQLIFKSSSDRVIFLFRLNEL